MKKSKELGKAFPEYFSEPLPPSTESKPAVKTKTPEEIYYDLKEKNEPTGASQDIITITAITEYHKQFAAVAAPAVTPDEKDWAHNNRVAPKSEQEQNYQPKNNIMKSGIELITAERQRQIEVKGYNAEHDEMESAFQLSTAAGMYIANAINTDFEDHTHYDGKGDCARFQLRQIDTKKWGEEWPWEDKDGRDKADVLTSLVKAGALVAAEIDNILNNQS